MQKVAHSLGRMVSVNAVCGIGVSLTIPLPKILPRGASFDTPVERWSMNFVGGLKCRLLYLWQFRGQVLATL